jgi:hypothetical protein
VFREAVPIPIGNVARDGCENAGNQDKADTADETVDPGLSEEEHDEDGFEKVGGEFNSQQSGKDDLSSRRMIDEKARRIVSELFLHLFHSFALLLASWIVAVAQAGEKINAVIFTNVRFHGVEHRCFVRNFVDPGMSQWEQIVPDEVPDKHDDSAQNACEKDAFHGPRMREEAWTMKEQNQSAEVKRHAKTLAAGPGLPS